LWLRFIRGDTLKDKRLKISEEEFATKLDEEIVSEAKRRK